MALYTGKGDTGTTKVFDTKSGIRISKGSLVSEALGALDECNSFLGLCKVESAKQSIKFDGIELESIVHMTQENLFIIQAELAGAEKTLGEQKLRDVEEVVDGIERKLPPINTFFISGGTELAARFDVARTFARKAERRVVKVVSAGDREMDEWSLAYLNRLSSLLYALARFSNYSADIGEVPPKY